MKNVFNRSNTYIVAHFEKEIVKMQEEGWGVTQILDSISIAKNNKAKEFRHTEYYE
jgi:hypothetical protein